MTIVGYVLLYTRSGRWASTYRPVEHGVEIPNMNRPNRD